MNEAWYFLLGGWSVGFFTTVLFHYVGHFWAAAATTASFWTGRL